MRRRRAWRLGALVAVVGCCGSGEPRGESPVPRRAPSEPRRAAAPAKPSAGPGDALVAPASGARAATTRVGFRARGAPLAEVLAAIGRQAGVNLILEPGVEERVDLSLFDLPWRRALEIVCQRTGCEVERVGEDTYYVVQPLRVTIQ